MKVLIPNMVSPLPDELLYSWVLRLAKINGLSPIIFFETYFSKDVFGKGHKVPVEIRRGFKEFYSNLDVDISASELYLKLSTMQFELLAYPEKIQTRFINNIFRKESVLNNIKIYFFNKFNMCPECIKEDIETYGDVYIHRSHQLSGVKVCHKHHTPLMIQYPNRECEYLYDDMEEMILSKSLQEECDYADYVCKLLDGNIQSNSTDLMNIVFNGFGLGDKNKKDIIVEINKVLRNSQFSNVWSKNNDIVPIEDLIRLLMYLYPNPQDVLTQINGYNLIICKHCDKCNQDYYITNQGLKDGWGCTYCDEKLGEEELLNRLIKVIGNNEYIFKSLSTGKGGRLVLYHKHCKKELSLLLGSFLFRHTKCKCNLQLQRAEAEKKIKEFSNFKLIDFNGSSKPATFFHNDCGQYFTVCSFREFLRTPKCRCCEIQQDITPDSFRQKVKDLVGNEYEVLTDVFRLEDKVKIRHKKCDTIQTYTAYHFLEGARCSKCYIKMSIRKTNIMLEELSNGRYKVIGHNKYFLILWDNKEEKEIQLSGKHIAQELLRPTPSSILEIDVNENRKQISTWDTWYRLCLEYKKEFGHLYVKRNEKYKGFAFYDWVGNQRMDYNKGLLPEDKVQKLKELGFVFDTVLYNWNIRFEEYKQYVADTGDRSPKRNVIYNGKQVGNWVRTQKQQEERGKLQPRFKEILLNYNSSFFDKE